MPSCEEIAKGFTNTSLKKLVNVYQLQFQGFKPPGFGDYLRGCFSMAQYIATLNRFCGTSIEFDMDLSNHPMGKHIVQTGKPMDVSIPAFFLNEFIINSIDVNEDPEDPQYQRMFEEIVKRMNALTFFNENGIYYGFCCKYEIYNTIDESIKEKMRSRLTPTPAMAIYMKSSLAYLNLKPKEFSVLHVRCLDADSFPPKHLSDTYFKTLDELVEKHCSPSKKYLILSNHNGVKEHYKDRDNFYTRPSKICHLGLDSHQQDDATRDTLLDFFLLSNASDCVGITPYGICGFSQEGCKLYNIPHTYVKFPHDPKNFTMAHMSPAQRMTYDRLYRPIK